MQTGSSKEFCADPKKQAGVNAGLQLVMLAILKYMPLFRFLMAVIKHALEKKLVAAPVFHGPAVGYLVIGRRAADTEYEIARKIAESRREVQFKLFQSYTVFVHRVFGYGRRVERIGKREQHACFFKAFVKIVVYEVYNRIPGCDLGVEAAQSGHVIVVLCARGLVAVGNGKLKVIYAFFSVVVIIAHYRIACGFECFGAFRGKSCLTHYHYTCLLYTSDAADE